MKVRCKETDLDSFFGNFLYEQKIARDHFLRKLNEVIDWDRFTRKLLSHYKGKGEIGQAPYNPTIMLKMLLLSYLWNVSERMIEVLANDSLSISLFLGLGADEKAPDHSTLTLFKDRLMGNAGLEAYEELFDEIVRIAREKGVKFGKLQIVDSVHLVADVNIGALSRRYQFLLPQNPELWQPQSYCDTIISHPFPPPLPLALAFPKATRGQRVLSINPISP